MRHVMRVLPIVLRLEIFRRPEMMMDVDNAVMLGFRRLGLLPESKARRHRCRGSTRRRKPTQKLPPRCGVAETLAHPVLPLIAVLS
jgi:hypothetical protein